MKRTLCLLLALCITLCCAACGGVGEPAPQPEATGTPLPMRSATPEPEIEKTPEPEPTPSPAEQPAETPQASGGTGGWSALYTEYQKRFTADIEAFNTGTDTALIALKLTKGEVDLAFTAAFFEADAATSVKMLFEMFGLHDVTYAEQGDTAVAEGTDAEGAPVKIELKFDGGNTAAMYYHMNGELSMELSLCVTDDHAAKLYKSYEADNPQTLCAIVRPNGDVWMGVDATVLDGTLYQNEAAASAPSFATALPENYTYIGGVLTKS